ncbi:putative bifunctional inhibitor/plant lipid transfer protein/seed storage helical domain superfamily [Helianthus annuus]|nr:putative bifunctional inhibitor/plant lipid transfer protein/seed storage helical domain superfamily [Helianthus annuus]
MYVYFHVQQTKVECPYFPYNRITPSQKCCSHIRPFQTCSCAYHKEHSRMLVDVSSICKFVIT